MAKKAMIVKQQKETYISENSTASFSETTSETTIPSVSESIVLKEPDGKTVVDTSYVRLIDGVKPEMMHAGYWIKDGDDKVRDDYLEEVKKIEAEKN